MLAGLVLSFAGIGLFVATVGFAIGLDGDVFRAVSAVLLAGLGVVLLSGAMQQRFAMVTGRVSDAGSRLIARVTPTGIKGQFAVGVLLGAVWSPCVGPTLGAASVLAAQRRDLVGVVAVMIAFGLGTGVPLLIVGSLSRAAYPVKVRTGLTGMVAQRPISALPLQEVIQSDPSRLRPKHGHTGRPTCDAGDAA